MAHGVLERSFHSARVPPPTFNVLMIVGVMRVVASFFTTVAVKVCGIPIVGAGAEILAV